MIVHAGPSLVHEGTCVQVCMSACVGVERDAGGMERPTQSSDEGNQRDTARNKVGSAREMETLSNITASFSTNVDRWMGLDETITDFNTGTYTFATFSTFNVLTVTVDTKRFCT